jgi:methionyl-tRNA formyltransferase
MLHKEELVIGTQDTSSDLHDKLAELGAVGLVKVLTQIENGTLHAEPQDEALVTYAEKLTKTEAVIDWNESAEVIARKVRGLNAWPVAQTTYQGQVLRIWQAEALAETADLPAGVVRCAHKHIDVATGQGMVRLLEVQLPNGKRISAPAFLAAHDVNGVQLG